ncbi:hypothetical protein [Photorhabdus namnaonensis]|uniref:Baseplate J-like protein n=1 Tax=Photorhabdus namnaonensis TaxID=1851568 RepID=A0A1B8YD63_9GAMM|nr:hypothetical protein [Photorhabdus namnaonensis]OCA53091.1 hypothetical protein Phpb_04143 [Photorhabdus namnaonensis]
MGLTELKDKLSAIVPETEFKLDERSTLDMLNWLQEYSKKIPFGQEKEKFWDSFYFIQKNNPDKLAEIYQNVNKADGHLPAHQAFVLAFLKLLETTKILFNTFPVRHRDLYYRELLGLKPRNAQADSVALGITLNTDNAEYLIPKGTLFDAGQDSAGNPLQYASDADLLANQGKLTDLRWYRKDNDGWKSAILLNHSDNIKLPENGIKLFSPTNNDSPVILSGYLIICSLFDISEKKLNITLALEDSWNGNPTDITAKIRSENKWTSLSVRKEANNLKLLVSDDINPIDQPITLNNMTFKVPTLNISVTNGSTLPNITGITINSTEAKIEQYSIYPMTNSIWSVQKSETQQLLTNDTFYLGFTGVLPGQTLSLYWQLDGFEEFSISWFYLNKDNTWQLLTQLVNDQTRNLFNRGTLKTLLPQNAFNQTSLMPTNKYWLKAEMIPKVSGGKTLNYPRINGLLYNAITATLINVETIEADHLLNGLTANNIKQPVNSSVAISEVAQPWTSWNGRPKEDEQTFLKRVPSRLSHRNRALNWGDIVTLLKERFVSIFDVKYPSTSELTKIPAPEKRQLIVIPNNRYKDNDDSLRPELNQARLTEMVEWIDQLSSPWATIEIQNPTYVDVPISYELVFASGVNPDYGRHQLQQELSRIYMPWGENIAIGVTPGNRIDYYQLLATIQQSPYVERVTNLTLQKDSLSTDAVGKSIEADDDEVLILVW